MNLLPKTRTRNNTILKCTWSIVLRLLSPCSVRGGEGGGEGGGGGLDESAQLAIIVHVNQQLFVGYLKLYTSSSKMLTILSKRGIPTAFQSVCFQIIRALFYSFM